MRTAMNPSKIAKSGVLPALLIAALLAGCSQTTQKAEEGPTFRLGSLRTQIAGGDPKYAGTGQLVGAIVGKGVEAPTDDADKPLMADALRKAYALPVGEKSLWKNDANGHNGAYISTREGYRNNGTYCREFQETIFIGKDTYQGYGASCKEADGNWKRIDPGDFPSK
jgi:surface antigen